MQIDADRRRIECLVNLIEENINIPVPEEVGIAKTGYKNILIRKGSTMGLWCSG